MKKPVPPPPRPEIAKPPREFLAVFMHQLRSPISAMQGTNYLLNRKLTLPAPAPLEDLQRVLGLQAQALDSLKELLDQVQALLQLDQVSQADTGEAMEVVGLLAQVVAEINRPLAVPRVTLESSVPAGLMVPGNAAAVETALRNLVSNALKFSPADSHVNVAAGVVDGKWTVSVTDRGCGIPVGEQGRIFEPFFRASNVGKISGSGLGLLIAKRVADLHGGAVEIISGADGTSAKLALPTRRSPGKSAA